MTADGHRRRAASPREPEETAAAANERGLTPRPGCCTRGPALDPAQSRPAPSAPPSRRAIGLAPADVDRRRRHFWRRARAPPVSASSAPSGRHPSTHWPAFASQRRSSSPRLPRLATTLFADLAPALRMVVAGLSIRLAAQLRREADVGAAALVLSLARRLVLEAAQIVVRLADRRQTDAAPVLGRALAVDRRDVRQGLPVRRLGDAYVLRAPLAVLAVRVALTGLTADAVRLVAFRPGVIGARAVVVVRALRTRARGRAVRELSLEAGGAGEELARLRLARAEIAVARLARAVGHADRLRRDLARRRRAAGERTGAERAAGRRLFASTSTSSGAASTSAARVARRHVGRAVGAGARGLDEDAPSSPASTRSEDGQTEDAAVAAVPAGGREPFAPLPAMRIRCCRGTTAAGSVRGEEPSAPVLATPRRPPRYAAGRQAGWRAP